MEYDLNDIESFLTKPLPDIPEETWTFLDIAGFPHYENVISNIYAYYFDKENPHGFEDLFLKALFEAIRNKAEGKICSRLEYLEEWSEWSVMREESVERKRIDILLEETSQEENTYIIIENKVYASLNNPLETYWNRNETDRKIGVVLSLFPEEPSHNGFINITHQEFLYEIKKLQGLYLERTGDRDLYILKDLIITMKKDTDTLPLEKVMKFYQDHHEKIESINELRNQVISELLKSFENVKSKLNLTLRWNRAVLYRGLKIPNEKFLELIILVENENDGIFCLYIECSDNKVAEKLLTSGSPTFKSKYKKAGIEKGEILTGSRSYAACKYYSLEEINYRVPNLEEIIEKTWIPLLREMHDFINQK
ncbi:PD-(D/E)XK nuclease family protein [Ekhidna sp. MALMAid0563]|uniref:PD-(D/E)XK nuclease family protein n=1 Tax=Ekhidna sp. MALMAid0563 TaxID=3143937 RepID=UPI0032DF57B7